jgi:hypothetical protein
VNGFELLATTCVYGDADKLYWQFIFIEKNDLDECGVEFLTATSIVNAARSCRAGYLR